MLQGTRAVVAAWSLELFSSELSLSIHSFHDDTISRQTFGFHDLPGAYPISIPARFFFFFFSFISFDQFSFVLFSGQEVGCLDGAG